MKHGKAIAWILLAALLALSGCSGGGASGTDNGYQEVNLSMAVNGTDTQIDSLVANYFAQLVMERSGGNVR